jgi:hypothetical protein
MDAISTLFEIGLKAAKGLWPAKARHGDPRTTI